MADTVAAMATMVVDTEVAGMRHTPKVATMVTMAVTTTVVVAIMVATTMVDTMMVVTMAVMADTMTVAVEDGIARKSKKRTTRAGMRKKRTATQNKCVCRFLFCLGYFFSGERYSLQMSQRMMNTSKKILIFDESESPRRLSRSMAMNQMSPIIVMIRFQIGVGGN